MVSTAVPEATLSDELETAMEVLDEMPAEVVPVDGIDGEHKQAGLARIVGVIY